MVEEFEGKKEFLRREEIKTMQKEIARLREIETQEERKKIATIKTEEKTEKVKKPQIPPPETILPAPLKEKKVPLSKPPQETTSPGILIPKPVIRRPSQFKKIVVRAAAVFFCFLLVGFFYWLFAVRNPPAEEETPKTEEVSPIVEETPKESEITIPPPLIPVEDTKTPEISKNEEIPAAIKQLMTGDLPANVLTRIVIKDTTQGQPASLEEISEAFQVGIPEEIFQALESDYTLSVFNQAQGKRIALVAAVKDKNALSAFLQNWETKIAKEGIFISGRKIPSLFSSFRTASYQGTQFRYLTISKLDYGVCYTIFDDYFIFTTSFESFKKVLGELKSITLEKNIGQLFIVGFDEKTVTPELEEFFKKYRPGGVLLLSKNIESKEQLKSLTTDLQALSLEETGFPLLISVDQEGGVISRVDFLEEKTAQSEIKNIEEAYQIGLKRGQELKELGINLNLAPLLDFDLLVNQEEKSFIYDRSFQKTPLEIGNFSKAMVTGQKTAQILTAIKHYPGYDGIVFNPEGELATLETTPEISQFKKATEASPEFVMTANVIYKDIDPALPFTFSQKGVQFLKKNLGASILTITDDLDQNSLLNKFSLKEILTKPVEAGVDILIFSGYRLPVEQGLDEFSAAVKSKDVSESKLQTAVSRIIQLKQNLLE